MSYTTKIVHWNLSNPTHQGTCEMRRIVQQGRIQDFKLGGASLNKKSRRAEGGAKIFWGISRDKSRFYVFFFLFFPISEGETAWRGRPPPGSAPVQDVRTCLIRYTKGPGKCVGLYRIPECSGFILVNKYFGTINFCRMSENSGDM